MHLAQDNDVVHTHTPDRSDQPFGKAILPRRGRCGRLSLCTCCRQYPGAATGRILRSTRPAISAFPDMAVGTACTSSFSRCYGGGGEEIAYIVADVTRWRPPMQKPN